MKPRSQHKKVRPRACPERSRRATIEPLEGRLLCRIMNSGGFVITPPGGGQGHSTIDALHPQEGLIGLRTAEAQSNGVVNWEITQVHEWTPGEQGGPHQFA
jgi:hypothetical protein